MPKRFKILLVSLSIVLVECNFARCSQVRAHEPHLAVTYEVTEAVSDFYNGPHLRLWITGQNEEPIAARFSINVDGKPFVPPKIGKHGLRFTSIHESKQNTIVVTYARGSGPVLIPLPARTRGTVTATRGFEFMATTESYAIDEEPADCKVRMRRWINLDAEGWKAADEHVHFDRTDRRFDDDWLKMLEADGLSNAHFLVAKGGNVPGVWARQYAYGTEGEAVPK